MNIPPYWTRGSCDIAGMRFRLHGSSHTGMEEARARMEERELLFRRWHEEHSLTLEAFREGLSGLLVQEKGHAYEAELLEPTLERPAERSVVTRNRYGAEVLNTTELCFVDVDAFPATMRERFKALLGGKRRTDEERLLAELQSLHREQPGLSIRLYRTAGGWRLILAAGEELTLASPLLRQLQLRLKADPLYVSLCQRQGCWRARLTPKPGRLSVKLGRYPRRTASDTPAEGEEEWLAAYREACRGRAVCRLVECFGREIHHPLVAWHDERTAALRGDLPLV